MTPRGWIGAAVLATGVAGAVALLAGDAPAPRGQVVKAVDSLPWDQVLIDGRPVSAAARPTAVLYILPTCEHCDSAAVTFASTVGRIGLNGLIISASSRARAEEYRLRFELPTLATDSTLAFARAAGINVVPVLGRPAGAGRIAFAPLSSPSLIRHYLKAGH
ncbi:MAG TPA: hypothetical protein VFZ56_06045 [Gemmatimonadaceae bacterium]